MRIVIFLSSIFLLASNCLALTEPDYPSAKAYPGGAWSPILVGALIGLLSCATRYFSKKPIGASSAYATVSGMIGKYFARDHTLKLKYFKDNPPKWGWELLFVLFAIVGGFLAAFTGNEIDFRFSPSMWGDRVGDAPFLRFLSSLVGGVLLAIGARIAGGCTSGHGISGTQEMSLGSWISLLSFFIGGALAVALMFQLYKMEKAKQSQTGSLINPIIFGVIFGYLLQKGGVTKYHVLIGSLTFEDFTVWIVILAAILVGMIGIFFLEQKGLIEKKVKKTQLGPNIIGGLIFGIGFGLSGYCPGTGAAAIGQGSMDALVSAIGLIVGSYIYGELSGFTDKKIKPIGDLGEVTFYSIFNTTKQKAVQVTSVILILAIVVLNYVNG